MKELEIILNLLNNWGVLGLLTIAFTAWAIVVYRMGIKILSKLDVFREMYNSLDKRLVVIEHFIPIVHNEFHAYKNGRDDSR